MKKNMLTIIKKEFARFFRDKRMVFTTILMPGLLIYLIYSFMGAGMMREFMTDETYVANAYMQNMPEELAPLFAQLSAGWTEISASETDAVKTQIQDKGADVLIVFPKEFVARVEAYDVHSGDAAPNVEIYYNSTESESVKLRSLLMDILDDYESSMANRFDVNAGDASYDLATEKDVAGQIFAMILPMLLMSFMFSGCVAVAPEAIAGEKERGTIATLLVTPMKRSALALGKIISLSCIALLSGLSSFLGTMSALPKMLGGAETGMNTAVYGIVDYVMLLGLILTTVLVMVSLISVISAFAKSIKEASTAVSPLMIIVMVISLTPMFSGGGERSLGWFLIPIYNSVLCIHGIFSFSGRALEIGVTIVVNLLCAGVLSWVLTRLFNSEKVMFSK